MKKWFKRVLFTLVVFVIVALVGAAVFLLTFDPNAYKNKVAQLVYERYQRHLSIEGDIELSLFPRIGLAVEQVTLSNQDSETPFASLDSARFAIAVWPLLWNKLVVDHVAVSGFKVWVQRDEEGQFNFSDLLQRQTLPVSISSALSPITLVNAESIQTKTASLVPDATQAEFQIDIAGLDLKEGEIHFYDQPSTTQMRVVDLELNTGRMTFGQPFDVIFKGSLAGERPVAKASLEGQALMRLEPHLHRYSAQKMNVSLVGNVGAYTAQSATLRGALELLTHTEDLRARQLEFVSQGRWEDENVQLNKVQLNLNAAQLNLKRNLQVVHTQKLQLRATGFLPMSEGLAEHKLELALDAPKINLDPDQVQAEPVALSFKQTHGSQMFGINIRSKNVEGAPDNLNAPEVQVDIAGKEGAQAWKLETLSTLTWKGQDQQLAWDNLRANWVVESEHLNPNPAQGKLTGTGTWFVPEKKVVFEAQWQSANTQADLQSTLTKDKDWLVDLNVNAVELDLNPWLKQASPILPSKRVNTTDKTSLYNVMLPSYMDWAGVPIKLNITAGELRYRQFHAQDFSAQVEQRDRTVFLEQLQAQIFNGALQAQGSWQHLEAQRQLKFNLKEVDLELFSKAVDSRLRLTGVGSVKADLQTQGVTPLAHRAYLDGSLQLQADSGQLVGWDIWRNLEASYEAARNVFSGQVHKPSEQLSFSQSTPFKQFYLDMEWQQGQAYFKKLLLKADGLSVKALPPSYFDSVNKQIELDLQVDLMAKSLPSAYQNLVEMSSHPFYVRLSGPWLDPVYRVQWSRLQQPLVLEAIEHGLLGLLDNSTLNGLPIGLGQVPSSLGPSPTLGDSLKNLLKP